MKEATLQSLLKKVCHDFAGILNHFTMMDLSEEADQLMFQSSTQKGCFLLQGYRFIIQEKNITDKQLRKWIADFEDVTKSICVVPEENLENVSLMVVISLMILQENIRSYHKILIEKKSDELLIVFNNITLRHCYITYFKEKKDLEKASLLSCFPELPIYLENPSRFKWILKEY